MSAIINGTACKVVRVNVPLFVWNYAAFTTKALPSKLYDKHALITTPGLKNRLREVC